MIFSVTWTKEALDSIADLWIEAINRDQVNRDIQMIDKTLESEAANPRHRHHEGLYRFDVGGISVAYTVNSIDRIADIVAIGILN